MRYPFIIHISRLHVRGMALYPFILFRNSSISADPVMMNHELIHHRQQVELLIIPFYLMYLLHYIINRFKYPDHITAYRNIVFEKEAYAHDADPAYLRHRPRFAFRAFF